MILGFLREETPDYSVCQKHDKVEEYFCIDCNQSVCASCVILGNHKEHKILTLNEIQKFAEQSLQKTEKLFKGVKVTQSLENLQEYAEKMKEKSALKSRHKMN